MYFFMSYYVYTRNIYIEIHSKKILGVTWNFVILSEGCLIYIRNKSLPKCIDLLTK